jgi:hypothetical protein
VFDNVIDLMHNDFLHDYAYQNVLQVFVVIFYYDSENQLVLVAIIKPYKTSLCIGSIRCLIYYIIPHYIQVV